MLCSGLLHHPPDFRSLTSLALLCAPLAALTLSGRRLSARRHLLLALLTAAGLVNEWLLLLAAVSACLLCWRLPPRTPAAAGFPEPAAGQAAAAGTGCPAGAGPRQWPARLLLALLVAAIANAWLNDGGDAWWWLNEGRALVQHGLDGREWFTATVPAAVVPPNNWLSALLAYRLFAVGGWPALRIAGVLCVCVPAWCALLRWPLSSRLVLATVCGWLLLHDEFALRAIITVLPLLALAQWLTATARRPLPAAAAYALLVALWANCHLSFFIALLFPAARLVAALAGGRRPDRTALALLVAGAAGACLHPAGPGSYRLLADMLATRGTAILDIFQPPALTTAAFVPALL